MTERRMHWLLPLMALGLIVMVFHVVPALHTEQWGTEALRHLAWVLPLVVKLASLD